VEGLGDRSNWHKTGAEGTFPRFAALSSRMNGATDGVQPTTPRSFKMECCAATSKQACLDTGEPYAGANSTYFRSADTILSGSAEREFEVGSSPSAYVLLCIRLFDSAGKTTSSATKAVAASSAMLPLVTAQTVGFDRRAIGPHLLEDLAGPLQFFHLLRAGLAALLLHIEDRSHGATTPALQEMAGSSSRRVCGLLQSG
jgi:hypothetical protein